MLKETEAEETIGFFVTFLSLMAFRLGVVRTPWAAPLATLMNQVYCFFSFVTFIIFAYSSISVQQTNINLDRQISGPP